MMTIREQIEKFGIASEEERERLRAMRVSAAQRYISLRVKGIQPHGPGKSTTRLAKRRANNKVAKMSRRANRG